MLRPVLTQLLRTATAPLDSRGRHAAGVDAVIALGAPVWDDGRLPPTVRERVEVALEMYRAAGAKYLVMSGGSPHGACESQAMAQEARRLGATEVIAEDQSRTTAENARYCAELLLPEARRVILVSQPFHLRRACLLFRRAGFDPVGCAAAESVHYKHLGRGFRWTAREYAAWLVTALKGA